MKRHLTCFSFTVTLAAILVSCQTSDSVNGKYSQPSNLPTTYSPAKNYNISSNAKIEQLVHQALTHHPALIAAEQKVNRLQAKVNQDNSLPDPKARVGFGRLAETAAGEVQGVIGVEQQLPYPGKLRAKANASQKEADAARAELENIKLVIAERVRFAYWDYYLATQEYKINQKSRESLVKIQELVDALFRIANQSKADLVRTKTEISKIDQELIDNRKKIGVSKAKLNALLNRPVGSPLPSPKRSSIPSNSSLAKLIVQAETTHPEIRAAQSRVDAYTYRLQKAKLDYYPDFLVGVQQSFVSNSGLAPSATGKDQTMVTLGMTIPLWQKPRHAKIDEANAGIAEMQASMDNSRAGLRQRVEDAWIRAKASRETIDLYDKRLIPEAKEANELALQEYNTQSASFIDVLDTWRVLLKFQLQQETFRSSLGKASASLKSAAAIK